MIGKERRQERRGYVASIEIQKALLEVDKALLELVKKQLSNDEKKLKQT